MANEGHIIVKKDKPRTYRQFYGALDKKTVNGKEVYSNKPAFCYPSRIQKMGEDIDGMQKALDLGHVPPDHRMEFEHVMKQRKARHEEILEQRESAVKSFQEDPVYWESRYKELKKVIQDGMPSRKDVKEKRVNPHSVLKREKEGLEEAKREFMVIGKLIGKETNLDFLRRE